MEREDRSHLPYSSGDNGDLSLAYTPGVAEPCLEIQKKELSDHFLKVLLTQVVASENEDLEIKDFVPAYANNAMNFAKDDLGSDKAMAGVLLYILTAVFAFIFALSSG